ncbi:hypothetical protein P5673_017795 [Acropora cervicornis]|uniref:Uncharacterized protein n=1 Tax=Acropora cervicornis TaxID=6130 RepID=A0AAD9QF24_ACRCE|nr:hypothetical protein P5673_017795 [Acropora cervicornis]
MKMRRGKVSGFAIGIVVLLTFQQQDAVYGSVTTSVTSSLSTTSASLIGSMTTTSSPTQTLGAIVATPTAAASTSGTSSELTGKTSSESTGKTSSETYATSTTGTTSSSTCATVTVTVKGTVWKSEVAQILHDSFFIESKYREPNITHLKIDPNKITFSFCVKVVFDGKIKSDFESQAMKLLNATKVTVEINGVEITGWKAVDGECDKCSGGGGGPIKIQGSCKPKKENHSCKGVEVEMKTKDCSNFFYGLASFGVHGDRTVSQLLPLRVYSSRH